MPHTRINFKLIKNLTGKNETMVILVENISDFFHNIGIGKNFLTMIQNPDAIKKKQIHLTIWKI